ncbi:hypothetical protein LX32DRAFT_567922 [Colletotrichum zoysiae]|uniref:Esterase-like protein n=1 Tax=Colletotrichum zoysiae TaxID=1216348 RepID=A0AAD9HB07_9PEZI|nr:hypothetical protein LX32DRAFT_567922 [Colletotrichum zoysiae]
MKRCTAVRPLLRSTGSAPSQFCQCRHKSEGFPEKPSPSFRRHEFARKTEKGLRGYDQRLKVDSTNKTIGTSVGDLPISPVMDPRWMEARTRYRTPKPKRPKDVLPAGRFRKKLEANPYALALTTPVRFCKTSEAHLPKYFLQEFKLIENPETGGFWWTPGDLDVMYAAKEWERDDEPREDGAPPEPHNPAETPVAQQKATGKLLRRSPTCYVLARRPLLRSLSGSKKRTPHGDRWRGLLSTREGPLTQRIIKRQVWREDMDDFILDNMRRNVMKYLVYFADLRAGQDHRSYLLRLGSWERAETIPQRGCLLWYHTENGPQRQGAATGPDVGDAAVAAPVTLEPFSMYDVPKAKYERKLPVYDLRWLLGEDHLAKLREIPMFRDSSLFLLRKQRSIPLQLYLWKLQAYMVEYETPEDSHLPQSESSDDQPSSTGEERLWGSSHENDAATPALPEREGHKDLWELSDGRNRTSSGHPDSGRKDPKKAWQAQAGHKKRWTTEVPSSASNVTGRRGL